MPLLEVKVFLVLIVALVLAVRISLTSRDQTLALLLPLLRCRHRAAVAAARLFRISRDTYPRAEKIVRTKMTWIYGQHRDVAAQLLRLFFHDCFIEVQLNLVSAMEAIDEQDGRFKDNQTSNSRGEGKAPRWKKVDSKELGISSSMIDKSTRKVLNGLKRKGFEVYLVGGCVMDLILQRTSKDFDILTSAELREATRTFSWGEVVGRRFPICHVHVGDTVIEVSSFSISTRSFGRNSSSELKRPVHCDDKDFRRWSNCLKRDFTINRLFIKLFSL